jgi:hypothetical protein
VERGDRGHARFGPGRLPCRSLLIALVAATTLMAPAGASAATITVNTTSDVSASACTLRDAITAANADADHGACTDGQVSGAYGDDTIGFAPAVTGTIRLGSALPSISSNLIIQGPGAGSLAVSRDNLLVDFRIFQIDPGNTASISGLTITNGDDVQSGGLQASGGGVLNFAATLTLDGVDVTGNAVTGTRATGNASLFGTAVGGGIYNENGTLTLTRSIVSGNTATGTDSGTDAGGSGAIAEGAGVENDGTLDIERSTISGNVATASSTNTHPGVFDRASGGLDLRSPVTISLSTVGDNQAMASNSSGTVTVAAGGIFNDTSSLTATGDTFAFNSGAYAANLGGTTGFTLGDTIISNPAGGGPNCNIPAPTDNGYNLEDANDCGFAAATDLVNTDPQLVTPLAANGSLNGTQTYALPPGSPAIDRGASAGQPTDQRDLSRPFDFTGIANAAGGDGADIGAFELQGICVGQTAPGGSCPVTPPASAPTGLRAAALKKCKKKRSRKKRRRCRKKAMRLPV